MSERLRPSQRENFFGDFVPESFSSEEKQILETYFTNGERPVFVAKNLPPAIIGALIGRHSQSSDSMRRVFLKEYASEKRSELLKAMEAQAQIGQTEHFLSNSKAEELLRKHFVGWGHDSLVAAMPLVIGFERVSQLGAKGIEDTRIGLSPIERSTRYGFFGEKVNGEYQYARSPVIMNSPYARLYQESIDQSLDLYCQLQEPVFQAYRRKFPDAPERKIKQMVFDTTRVLLVAANFTNLGIMVDGQAAESLAIKLNASQLRENRELGEMIEEEVSKVTPVLMERVRGEFGKKAGDYLSQRREIVNDLAAHYLPTEESEGAKKGVTLVDFDFEGENKVISRILWQGSNLSLEEVSRAVKDLSAEDKARIIEVYLGQRPDRRSKPGREFEEAGLSIQLVCRFAEWRDLQRNRILTPHWRLLDYSLGVDVGKDLEEFGFGQAVEDRLSVLAEAHAKIAKDYPVEAQYLVAFGALMPYLITTNMRELVSLAELRTDPGAHQDYARHASDMAKEAARAYPLLAKAFNFVNWR